MFTIFFSFFFNHLWQCQKPDEKKQKNKGDKKISAGLS